MLLFLLRLFFRFDFLCKELNQHIIDNSTAEQTHSDGTSDLHIIGTDGNMGDYGNNLTNYRFQRYNDVSVTDSEKQPVTIIKMIAVTTCCTCITMYVCDKLIFF